MQCCHQSPGRLDVVESGGQGKVADTPSPPPVLDGVSRCSSSYPLSVSPSDTSLRFVVRCSLRGLFLLLAIASPDVLIQGKTTPLTHV